MTQYDLQKLLDAERRTLGNLPEHDEVPASQLIQLIDRLHRAWLAHTRTSLLTVVK